VTTKNEVGRELAANELKPRQIVVLATYDRPPITIWVAGVGMDFVHFYAGTLNVSLLLSIREDGILADDSGKPFRVYEYLGEP
jgi:hypothetical protein